jgi:hypothetical protein
VLEQRKHWIRSVEFSAEGTIGPVRQRRGGGSDGDRCRHLVMTTLAQTRSTLHPFRLAAWAEDRSAHPRRCLGAESLHQTRKRPSVPWLAPKAFAPLPPTLGSAMRRSASCCDRNTPYSDPCWRAMLADGEAPRIGPGLSDRLERSGGDIANTGREDIKRWIAHTILYAVCDGCRSGDLGRFDHPGRAGQSPTPRAMPPVIARAAAQMKSRLIHARRSTSTPTFW